MLKLLEASTYDVEQMEAYERQDPEIEVPESLLR